MKLEIQVLALDRHINVSGLVRLIGSQSFLCVNVDVQYIANNVAYRHCDFSYFGSPPRSPVDNFVNKVDNNIVGII